MKKKELLKYIPSVWPEDNTAKVIKTPEGKVLMLMLPGWQVVGRENEECVIHFTWKEGYLTYYPKLGEWTRHKYTTLYYNSYVSGGGFDKESLETIMSYTNHCYAHGAIEQYETSIDYEKSLKAMDRKQKRIDESMKDTPRLPKDFKTWCTKLFAKENRSKVNVKLFQPYKDGTMERIFQIEHYSYTVGICITEVCRAYQKTYGGAWTKWMYGERIGAYGRFQHFWDKKDQSFINNLPKWHYVYDNLDSLDMTPAQRFVLRELNGRVDPSIALNRLKYTPELEHVLKNGLKRVAEDMVGNGYKGDELQSLPKQSIERLKAFDGGGYAAILLSVAPKIQDKYLKDFCKIKDYTKANMIITLAENYNINHVYKLLMAAGGAKTYIMSKYNDYLRMAEELGNNPHDEIIYRNKNWMQWHDRYLEEINRHKEMYENRRFAAIKKDYKLNKALFAWKDEEYLIKVPRSAAEICEEGRKQHHCVGAQPQYRERMARRMTFIVFLRKADNPKEPYYTIECDLSRVIQFYAAYDRQPDKEKVQEILTKWMAQVKKNAKKLQKAAG